MGGLTRVRDLDSVEDEWRRLLPSTALDTVFMTPQWQRTWLRTLGASGELVLLRMGDGQATGLAPLYRNGDCLSLLGDTDVTDYHELPVRKGDEAAFFPALVDSLADEPWACFRLTSLIEGSPTLQRLPALAEARRWRVAVDREDVAPGLALPATWDDLLASLSKKDRHELRRKLRRLEAGGACEMVKLAPKPGEMDSDLDEFLRLMRLSQEDKREFLTPERERFFRAMAEAMAAGGFLRLFFLRLDGRNAAAVLCFDYAGQRLLYNSGFDPEFRHLSVGLLLKADTLRDAIEDSSIQYYDFLRGDEPYKYDLGGRDRVLYRMTITRDGAVPR